MPSSNAEVAELLRRYAAALTLEGADRFKVKAYRRAADTIEAHDRSVADMVARDDDLTKLPGVGKAIAQKIADIVSTGKLRQLERSMSNLKPELVELAEVPSLNPAVVLRAYKKLKINSLAELREKLASGAVKDALGTRVDYQLRQGLDERPRMLLFDAEPIAERIERFLSDLPGVKQVSRVGSVRRKQETVGDLNFLVATDKPATVFKKFATFPGATALSPASKSEAYFRLSSGGAVQLYATTVDQWGLSLIERTGSVTHLDGLRAQAKKKRLAFTAGALSKKKVDLQSEAPIYRAIGLDYIEPELR